LACEDLMPNRNLSATELENANGLLAEIRERLQTLAGDDATLLFAYRRKIAKELGYDERSKPMVRRRIKALKRRSQNGICPLCREALPEKYVVLDRLDAAAGYTEQNTQLICERCDRDVQARRAFR
jgi:UTP:GlnB (protein PII) uridylyltransferase